MQPRNFVLAGATGNLGGRIATALLERGASVRALVRRGSAPERVAALRRRGVAIAEVDFGRASELSQACAGAACVISALSGLRPVIVEAQTALLDAAIAAGVPRFIPSDFCIDFTRLPAGSNRNLDLRREFYERLAAAPIAVTSIFNGAFMELLTGQAPFILFKLRRVLYWQDADQRMDFTTMDDIAAYTADAALESATPRSLHIAGDRISARELAAVAGDVYGEKYGLLRAGGLGRLRTLIKITRVLAPGAGALYPPWQGMQYMHNMYSGLAGDVALDNDRYPRERWTTARDVLAAHRGAA